MATSVKKSVPTRERILNAAKHLFQQRGFYAVGTAEILKLAKAPKGSMYHHFPDGKEQIAIAAVQMISEDVMQRMTELQAKRLNVAETINELAKGMAHWLKISRYREGTLLSSTSVGSVPDLPKLHAAINDAFDAWQQHIVKRLTSEGWSKSSAQSMAQTIIAAIEGAMILARIERDERVILKVATMLTTLLESRR